MMRALIVFLSLIFSIASFADDEDFVGRWTLSIDAAGIAPYEGLLEIEFVERLPVRKQLTPNCKCIGGITLVQQDRRAPVVLAG